MRKLIVKIFNLVYLAGAVLAIVAFCTKPIINTKVGLTLTKEQIADKLMEIFEGRNKDSSEGEGEVEDASYKISYRDSAADQKITREDIMKAFPNGFSIEIGVTIEAKDAFNINNKSLLKDSLAKSIDKSLDNVIGTVTTGLHNLIYSLTEKFAKTELKNQIDAQIQQYFAGASPVSDEDVDALYNNVYSTLNSDGTVTVESLADTIVGDANTPGSLLYILEEKKKESGSDHIYVVADPQPESSEVAADIAIEDETQRKYYLEVVGDNPATAEVEEKYYVRPTTADSVGAVYYVQKYDASSVTGEDIADKLAESLDSIPGLVEDKIDAASPTKAEFDATVVSSVHFYRTPDPKGVFAHSGVYDSGTQYFSITDPEVQPLEALVKADIALGVHGARQFVVANGDKFELPAEYSAEAHYYNLNSVNPTEEEYYNSAASNKYKVKTGEDSYEFAKKWEEGVQYYIETKIVNDVDTALSKLIEEMLGGGSSSEESGEANKAHYRAEGSSSEDELNAAVKEYIQKLLPMDTIYSFTEQADQYSTYVALGLIALFASPWALFGLVTIIRTLRKRKIWTKPWIVFFFAFIQVIFGVVLTYGTKYAMPLIAKYVPQLQEFLESSQLGLDIRTGCLIPSFVYLAFIPLTIAYIIVAHPVKYEYKMWKRDLRLQRLGRK